MLAGGLIVLIDPTVRLQQLVSLLLVKTCCKYNFAEFLFFKYWNHGITLKTLFE